MPVHGLTNAERAQRALAALNEQGGPTTLPEVLKSADVIPLMGKGWFGDALRLEMMPGMRATRGGAWRCGRAAFVTWLEGLAAVAALTPCMDEDGDHDAAR